MDKLVHLQYSHLPWLPRDRCDDKPPPRLVFVYVCTCCVDFDAYGLDDYRCRDERADWTVALLIFLAIWAGVERLLLPWYTCTCAEEGEMKHG
eukprot:scaffold92601_cov75-Cyclotella_meneghiniana.AAC.11